MSSKRVFNQSVNTGVEYRTESLASACAFYVSAPNIDDEIIVEFYLQFEATASNNQGIQLTPQPIAETIFIYLIPQEFRNTGFNLYGVIKSRNATTIEVWAITQDLSLETINEKLEQLIEEVNNNEAKIDLNNALQVGDLANELQQNISLGLLSGSLSVITAGTSLSALPPLTTGSSIITPLLSAGTGLL